jgi:hypothetical protein
MVSTKPVRLPSHEHHLIRLNAEQLANMGTTYMQSPLYGLLNHLILHIAPSLSHRDILTFRGSIQTSKNTIEASNEATMNRAQYQRRLEYRLFSMFESWYVPRHRDY